MLVGCNEFTLDPIEDPSPPRAVVVVEESFVQAPLPGLDVLLVVDVSLSMQQERQAIADGARSLLLALDELGSAWQLGVTTTQVGDLSGLLLGTPWVLTPDEPLRDELLGEMVLGGFGQDEQGLAAALAALERSRSGENIGFRRPGAALHVLFVSDGDDLSALTPEAFLAALQADGASWGGPVRASAVVGDVPGGCSTERGNAVPGVRYREVALASGGEVASVCEADLAGVLGELGGALVPLPDTFPLSRTPLSAPVVRVEGAPVVTGWTVVTDEQGSWLVFDAPPAAGVAIDVSYAVENAGGGP